MTLHRLVWYVAAAAACTPVVVQAQGFEINEIGSCAVGRGQAVVGATCNDPSVIYWNPGAATTLRGWSAYAGLAAIAVAGDFTADTSGRVDKADAPVGFPAYVFVNYGSRDGRWAVGAGAYAPYGLASQWRNDFAGRFEAEKAALATVYIQPNVAFRFAEGWSIGGGPVIGYSEVQLRQALDLASQHTPLGITFGQLGIPARTEFAVAHLDGHATAFGFNVGIHGRINADWSVGARYLSRLTFSYDNSNANFTQTLTGLTLASGNPFGVPGGTPLDAVLSPLFTPGATLSPQKVSTKIPHPAQLEVGLGYTGLTQTTLSADFLFTQFSSFSQLPLIFSGPAAGSNTTLVEDYKNSWSARFGVEHAFAIGIKGRAGFTFVKTPAPAETVTPLLPDQDRKNYTLGLGVPVTPRYTLDLGYLHVQTDGRRGRIVERTSESQTAAQLNSGWYQLSANIYSISLRANF